MSKGDKKRPRAAHVTKEQYDDNYEAIFRRRTTEPSDSPGDGADSEVLKEPGGQPDPQVEETMEGTK